MPPIRHWGNTSHKIGTAMPAKKKTPVYGQRLPADMLGIAAAASYLDVDPRTIRRWIAAGSLRAVRVGPRLIKILKADLDALRQPVGGGDAA
jgi:excisionase family DNA binding protein